MPRQTEIGWSALQPLLDLGLEDLLIHHWEEVALDQGRIPFDPDWDRLRRAERDGTLKIVAARRGGRLLGYNAFFVMGHMHYRSTLHALNDVIYVDPEERKGGLGLRLVRKSERLLAEIGVVKVFYHTKVHVLSERGTVGAVLERLGYTQVERVYAKLIG